MFYYVKMLSPQDRFILTLGGERGEGETGRAWPSADASLCRRARGAQAGPVQADTAEAKVSRVGLHAAALPGVRTEAAVAVLL